MELLGLLQGLRFELYRLGGKVHAVGADLLHLLELRAAKAQLLPGGGRDGDPVELAGGDLEGSFARCVLFASPPALQVGITLVGLARAPGQEPVCRSP